MGATAIIGAGAMLGGSLIGANAQESAAQTAANANLQGQQLTYQEWLQQQQNMKPWLQAGTGAVNSLAYGMGQSNTGAPAGATGPVSQQGGLLNTPAFSFDPTRISNNPDYQWVTQQGVNALAASGAAAGNYGSGNMGTALENYGQGAATQYMDQYYNQALNTYQQNLNSQYTMPYNMLTGLSTSGQGTATSEAQLGLQAANTMGQYGVGAGNALAAGQIGAANAYTGAINSGLNYGMPAYYMNQYMNQQYQGGNGLGNSGYMYNAANNPYDPYSQYMYGWGGAGQSF